MPIITRSANSRIIPRFTIMSAYQIYIDQVKGVMDNIRFTAQGMSYTPPQYGGLFGQCQVLSEEIVLQVIDYQVNS
jgi:hypothetical protein